MMSIPNFKLIVLVPSINPQPGFIQSLSKLLCTGIASDIEWVTHMRHAPARNELVRRLLSSGATYALWLDDDMTFNPDVAFRLLSHQQDVVSALMFDRIPPHYPVAYLKSPVGTRFDFLPLKKWSGGLEPVDCSGFGCVLTHRRVFEILPAPWFKFKDDEHSEDGYFYAQCAAYGVKVYLDSSTEVGHLPLPNPITKADYLAHNSAVSHTFMGV